ncbi:MAG: hypothetical protein LC667_01700 [Thioalkalivibrio sp.]|nr:hypothetical protein [Thioalkalivibrio sp.]
MADITASTTLDNSQFNRGLQDALKQARSFRSTVTHTLSFNLIQRRPFWFG